MPTFLVDGHVDLVYDMMRNHPGVSFRDLPKEAALTASKLRDGNVRVIVSALYCADICNGPETAAGRLKSLFAHVDERLDGIGSIRTAGELESCLEGPFRPSSLYLLENADALLEMDLDDLEERAIGVVGLTHVGRNRLGDGNRVSNPTGLTPSGASLVKKLTNRGFAVDVAHLSDPSFLDLMKFFNGPVLSSHTGFRFFRDDRRNLTREQLEAIFERGGVVGVSISPDMVSKEARESVEDVLKHIDWVVQRFGPDRVAIGSDFGGFDAVMPGIEDISKLPRLEAELKRLGYPDEAIASIMGGNWFRFYSALLPK